MAKDSAGADSNIYTVLSFVAFVALLGAVIYTFVRLGQLGATPFAVTGG